MNDFDRAARCAVKECPIATLGWLLPRLTPGVRYRGWLDQGIYLPPSAYEVGFLSAAHQGADVARLVEALAQP